MIPNAETLDKVMNTVEKGAIRFHGDSVAFVKEDDFVYISKPLGKVALNGVTLQLTEEEVGAIVDFIIDEILGGYRVV